MNVPEKLPDYTKEFITDANMIIMAYAKLNEVIDYLQSERDRLANIGKQINRDLNRACINCADYNECYALGNLIANCKNFKVQ